MKHSQGSEVNFNRGRALCKIAGEYPTLVEVIYEAVQNAVDANATDISVLLNRKTCHIAVRDNGDGVSIAKFEAALGRVCETQKERGKLGQFGIGIISALGKCQYFSFVSFSSATKGEGYNEWTFATEDIRAQAEKVVIPHRQRLDLVSKLIAPKGTRRGVTAVDWNTELSIFSYTKDKVINRIPSAQDLHDAIVERFSAALRRNNVHIGIAIVNEDGSHDLKAGYAKPYTGKRLPEAIISHPDAGNTTIRMYLARKTVEKGYAGKVSVGEADNDFRFAFKLFARSTGVLSSSTVEALTSGIFEGEILTQKAKLHENRKSFIENQALLGFCEAIEEWFEKEGGKHLENIQEQREDQRLQELGLQSLENLRLLLHTPRYSNLLDVISKFKRGTIGDDHVLPTDEKVLGKQKEKSLAVNGANGAGHEGSREKTEPENERENHHPFTVEGPRGRRRTVVKSDSLGLQFSHTAMEGSDKLYEFDVRNGIIHFNIRHPVWVACDRDGKGNRQLRQLQEKC